METDPIIDLLRSVAAGQRTPEEASRLLGDVSTAEVADSGRIEARVDHHRALRCGFPEVIFCQGKTPEQVAAIAQEILSRAEVVLATRASAEQAEAVHAAIPDARRDDLARLVWVDRRENPPREGSVVVASGGTADIPVAEEAARTAEVMGCR